MYLEDKTGSRREVAYLNEVTGYNLTRMVKVFELGYHLRCGGMIFVMPTEVYEVWQPELTDYELPPAGDICILGGYVAVVVLGDAVQVHSTESLWDLLSAVTALIDAMALVWSVTASKRIWVWLANEQLQGSVETSETLTRKYRVLTDAGEEVHVA